MQDFLDVLHTTGEGFYPSQEIAISEGGFFYVGYGRWLADKRDAEALWMFRNHCIFVLFGYPMGTIWAQPGVYINHVGQTTYYWNYYMDAEARK